MMIQIVAFVAGSAGLVVVSRASLRAPRSHGFYRFFAWEFILALVLLNLPVWFVDPLALHQVISWLLLIVCLVPLVLGVRTLRAHGRPVTQRAVEPQLLAFEKTSRLVTTGLYRYIRHPLYSSLLLLTWGTFFKVPALPGGVLALAATACLVATARADERECLRFFGPDYRDYMRRTKRFVPFLF
jgi:protein-S-isoprenylcysteine O-methyltransferase Ste14